MGELKFLRDTIMALWNLYLDELDERQAKEAMEQLREYKLRDVIAFLERWQDIQKGTSVYPSQLLQEDIRRVETYIAEHGRETGTVSWQMARDAFEAIKQELSNIETDYTKVELWVDGGSKGNPGWGYCSYAFGDIQETHQLGDGFTSNEAEYWAVLRGMQGVINCHDPKTIDLTIKTDSALVVGQLTKGWKVNAENLRPLIENAKHQLSQFASWQIEHVPRRDIELVLGH